MSETAEVVIDVSKPYYNRNPGEIGLLLDIYDAKSLQPETVGSRQFFIVNLRDKFTQLAQKTELYKLKGYFAKRNLLEDVTIECFRENCVIVLCPYNENGLKKLKQDYENGRINKYFVECLVTENIMKKLEVTDLRMKVKIDTQEFETVQSEWATGNFPTPYDMNCNDNAIRMLTLVKKLQVSYLQNQSKGMVQKMRDAETKYVQHLTDLITFIKRIRVGPMQPIKSYAEIVAIAETYKEQNKKHAEESQEFSYLTDYFDTVRMADKAVRHIENSVIFPLNQIRIGGESKTQMDKKVYIMKLIHNSKELLKENAAYVTKSPEYASKITKSERVIFEGFVSHLPSAVRCVLDLDEAIDEYFQSGNVLFKGTEVIRPTKQ